MEQDKPVQMSQMIGYMHRDIQRLLDQHPKEIASLLMDINSDFQIVSFSHIKHGRGKDLETNSSYKYSHTHTHINTHTESTFVRVWCKSKQNHYQSFILKLFPNINVAISRAKAIVQHASLLDSPRHKIYTRNSSEYFAKVLAGFTLDSHQPQQSEISSYYGHFEEDAGVTCGDLRHYWKLIFGPDFHTDSAKAAVKDFNLFLDKYHQANVSEKDVCVALDVKSGGLILKVVNEIETKQALIDHNYLQVHAPHGDASDERKFLKNQLSARYYFALMCGFGKLSMVLHEMLGVLHYPSDYSTYLWNMKYRKFAQRLILNLRIALNRHTDQRYFVQFNEPIQDFDGNYELPQMSEIQEGEGKEGKIIIIVCVREWIEVLKKHFFILFI